MRGDRSLDLVLTNLNEYYKDPIQRPPHGLSDHMSVEVQPKDGSQFSDSRLKIKTRDLKPSNRLAMRIYGYAQLAYRFGSSISLLTARRESSWEEIAALNGGMYRQECHREPSSGRGCLFP